MAETPPTDADGVASTSPDAPKKDANRQRILIGASIVSVIIAYVILKRGSGAAASSSGDTTSSTPTTYQGGYPSSSSGGYGSDDADVIAALQQIQTEIATDASTGQPSAANPTAPLTTPAPGIISTQSYGGYDYTVIPNPTIADADSELGIPLDYLNASGVPTQVAVGGPIPADALKNTAGTVPLFAQTQQGN